MLHRIIDLPDIVGYICSFLSCLDVHRSYLSLCKNDKVGFVGALNQTVYQVQWSTVIRPYLKWFHFRDRLQAKGHTVSTLSVTQQLCLTDIGVAEVMDFSSVASITCLDLHGSSEISDASLHIIGVKNKTLKKLIISYCHRLSDSSCTAIGQHLHNLTQISLSGCSVGDVGIRDLTEGCKLLKHVFINETDVTDVSTDYLARNLKDLSVLSIARNEITDTGIRTLALFGHELQVLVVSDCVSVSTVKDLIKTCRNLTYLDITNCINISSLELQTLVGKNPVSAHRSIRSRVDAEMQVEQDHFSRVVSLPTGVMLRGNRASLGY